MTVPQPDELARGCGPIKLEAAEMVRVSIPLVEPFRISSGEVRVKEALLLRVREGDFEGWGESSAMSGSFYSAETPDSCQRELAEVLLPAVLGRGFASLLDLNVVLSELTSNRFARVAIETAAWELIARRRGRSLHETLGLPRLPRIPSGLAIGLYDSEAELLAAIRRYGSKDYQRLKIKIKQGQDTSLVKVVRKEFGDIPLFVDANGDYTRGDFRVFEQLDDFGLMMFEQPLAKGDLEGAAMLQRRVRTPICLDESIETLADARRAIELGACRIVNIKLQRVGGFLEALRIMQACTLNQIALWIGTMPELGVGSGQALALTGHPGVAFPTDVEPSRRWYVDDVVEPVIALEPGGLLLPDGPGLGFKVDESKVAKFAVNRWQFKAGGGISEGPQVTA